MRFFKLFCFLFIISCSSANENSISTDSALTSEQEVQIAPELVVSAEVDSSDENPYDYKNHSKYYICNEECKDNTKVQNNGKIRGELILQVENEIISDLTEKFSNIIKNVDTAIMNEDHIFPAQKMIFEG